MFCLILSETFIITWQTVVLAGEYLLLYRVVTCIGHILYVAWYYKVRIATAGGTLYIYISIFLYRII